MIRLWHPMRDAHHCTYRLIALLLAVPTNSIAVAKLSFLDLFYLFPQYLRNITPNSDAVARKRGLKLPKNKDEFVHVPDIRLVYRDVQQYQKVAMNRMVGRGILEASEYKAETAALVLEAIPEALKVHIEDRSKNSTELLSYIANDIADLPMDGPKSILRQTRMEMGGRLR